MTLQWHETSRYEGDAARPIYFAETPFGRVTIKAVVRKGAPVAWTGKLPDGMVVNQGTLRACQDQVERIIAMWIERKRA